MKLHIIVFIISLAFISCKSNKAADVQESLPGTDINVQKTEPINFFPLTDYLKGQIYEIKNGGMNPFKVVIAAGHKDSGWLTMESLDKELADFLHPVIDSANLTTLFSENKFIDETLDALTLSYDPIKALPDSFAIRHWDIYIDPKAGNVKTVYIVKKLPENKIQQLTWSAGKGCNIKTIIEDAAGKASVEKEITIKWDSK